MIIRKDTWPPWCQWIISIPRSHHHHPIKLLRKHWAKQTSISCFTNQYDRSKSRSPYYYTNPRAAALWQKISCQPQPLLSSFRCGSHVVDLSRSPTGTLCFFPPAEKEEVDHRLLPKIKHDVQRTTKLLRCSRPLRLSSSGFGTATLK